MREVVGIAAGLLGAVAVLGGCASAGRVAADPPPGMVLIPAGGFLMGSASMPGLSWLEQGVDETPRHRVKLGAFWIDRYEATEAEYARFVADTGHPPPRLWAGQPGKQRSSVTLERRATHPVIDVSWYDADAYCRWAGKRLPTEAEWEKAARGSDGRTWVWGTEYRSGAANLEDGGLGDTAPVGGYPEDVSPYGVYDLTGNAMEWTASWYQAYPGSTLQRDDFGKQYRVLKGGAWTTPPLPFSRAANRHAIAPKWDHPHFGVRCAKD